MFGPTGLQLLENSTATGVHVAPFIAAQTIGAAAGLGLVVALFPRDPATGDQAVTIHPSTASATRETR